MNLVRNKTWLLPLVSVAALVLLVFLADPRGQNFFPRCLFHRLTGWNCPGCGTTRAAHDLLHGKFSQAFRDNALFVVLLPLFAWAGGIRIFSPARRTIFSPRWFWLLLGSAGTFTVWRNLPGGAWWNP
ncbi:MAG: hypothetical protein RL380_1129 [Verrucomicrobiota bacterium]